MHRESTQFQKGHSGNPGGRPKQPNVLRTKCRELTEELIERLRQIAEKADTDATSIAAAKLILAYGYGAPDSAPLEDKEEEELRERWSVKEGREMLAELRRLRSEAEPAEHQ